ncbi:AbiJ-NTD4 domain-containing protein [Tunturiibacter psychrotolerans]|uniref:AbiJ-NTD4 domain-containing protein n=1 Tax=Tunturiibacter psychrotolerans TaxID=3069686 RepID=UPI003D22067D
MSTVPLPPFSARSRREKNWIEEDFPVSARNGLLHVLNEAVEKDYLRGWSIAAKELRRIARVAPASYSSTSSESIKKAQFDVESQLDQLDWDRVYDFCERLHSHLTEDISCWRNDVEITITKGQAQSFFAEEVQRLFEEESLGYEFRDGLVQRRGKRRTITQTNKAEKVLADQKLAAARVHFSKALRYFHDRKKTDHENTVKEAVCAVEAAAKELFPDAKAKTLGDFVGWATNGERNLLPKTIGQTFSGLYGFRNSGEGVAHGAASGGVVTAELSEYILGTAASQIVFLADLARNDEEPPF